MESAGLEREGFVGWQRFHPTWERELLAALPTSPGVFAVRRRGPYRLLAGESDIAYIGYGTNRKGLRERVRQCFHPGPSQPTNRRILQAVSAMPAYELSWVQCSTVSEARRLADGLLSRFVLEHDQLPPLRRRR